MASTKSDPPLNATATSRVQFKNPRAQALWDAYLAMVGGLSASLARATAEDVPQATEPDAGGGSVE